MKHCLGNLLLDLGESELDVESCGIEPFTSPNSDEDITDASLFASWVDDLLALKDPGGNKAKNNKGTTFGSENSRLCSVETGAPLRSIRPDKRCVTQPRQK